MTIGELISSNVGSSIDFIEIMYQDKTILKDTKMNSVHKTWYSFVIKCYMTWSDDDGYIHFVVCLKNPKHERG